MRAILKRAGRRAVYTYATHSTMKTEVATTLTSYPRLPYETIKNDVIGRNYKLSLVFIGEKRARTLNTETRDKTYVPNVLSFPLAPDVGEIYITPHVAKREAKKCKMTTRGYVGFLFIHALLHLKGFRHGATMEKAEKQYLLKYGLQ